MELDGRIDVPVLGSKGDGEGEGIVVRVRVGSDELLDGIVQVGDGAKSSENTFSVGGLHSGDVNQWSDDGRIRGAGGLRGDACDDGETYVGHNVVALPVGMVREEEFDKGDKHGVAVVEHRSVVGEAVDGTKGDLETFECRVQAWGASGWCTSCSRWLSGCSSWIDSCGRWIDSCGRWVDSCGRWISGCSRGSASCSRWNVRCSLCEGLGGSSLCGSRSASLSARCHVGE